MAKRWPQSGTSNWHLKTCWTSLGEHKWLLVAWGHRVMYKYLFEASGASWGRFSRILNPENPLFFFLTTHAHGIAARRPLNDGKPWWWALTESNSIAKNLLKKKNQTTPMITIPKHLVCACQVSDDPSLPLQCCASCDMHLHLHHRTLT